MRKKPEDPVIQIDNKEIVTPAEKAKYMGNILAKAFTPGKVGQKTPLFNLNRDQKSKRGISNGRKIWHHSSNNNKDKDFSTGKPTCGSLREC